jgi:hypothetical protein
MSAELATLNPQSAELDLMMNRAQAREHVDQINNHFREIDNHRGEIRALVLNLHEKEGWRALGYNSWRDCVLKEFAASQTRLYELLDEAKVERNISDVGNVPVTARIAKELKHLEPEQQRSVAKEAVRIAPDGKLTVGHIQIAKEKLPRKPTKWQVNSEKQKRRDQEKRLKKKENKDLTAKVKSGGLTQDQAIVQMVNREKAERDNEWERGRATNKFRYLFDFDPIDRSPEEVAEDFVAKVNWDQLRPNPHALGLHPGYGNSRLHRCIEVITKIAEIMPEVS